MRVELPVRADLEEGNGQQSPNLRLVSCDPATGHEECRWDVFGDEGVDQRRVIPGAIANRAHVKGQRDGFASGGAGSNDLGRSIL